MSRPALIPVASPERLLRPVMPELDSLRGIACLAVLFLHGFNWRFGNYHFSRAATWFLRATIPGWLGVNLFFVLSGFLITGILVDSKNRPGYYRRFYVRRALRILPACYGLLILLLILGQAPWSFACLGFLYLSNMTSFFGVPMVYGPLWSLAVEEHYYLLWPSVVRKLSSRHLFAVASFLFLVTPLLRGGAFYFGHPDGINWYTWYVSDGLAAGSLLALVLRTTITRRQTWWLCVSLLGGAILVAVIGRPFGVLTAQRLLGAALQYTIAHVLFSGLLLLFLLVGTGGHRKWVNSRTLRFFGYISYGLYLVHFLVFRIYDKVCSRVWPALEPKDWHFGLVILRFVIGGAAATGLAYISRRYYEDWFLRQKDRLDGTTRHTRTPTEVRLESAGSA